VQQENGCIAWGGAVGLSPADDLFIRIEKPLNLDSDGQLIASVLSKKIAAGSTHIVIDIPIGPTAKISSLFQAFRLKRRFVTIAKKLGVNLKVIFSDGNQPVGRGIGPALEARDVLAVLKCDPNAPQDLRDRALTLAGHVLEFSPKVKKGAGKKLASTILDSGQAFAKFSAICEAQGGMREPLKAPHTHAITAEHAGIVIHINNRYINTVAKLAGAPKSKSAGIELLTPLRTNVAAQQPLYIIHAETKSELDYAINYINQGHTLVTVDPI
jgi:thymidine phosphorylase